MEGNNYKFQLINDEAELIQDAKDKFLTLDLHEAGRQYYSLGIIGAQSSGKSTLLNYMFNTGFAVLDSKKHRKQTTKGIWISRAMDSHLLVFDIEGSDSRERWEGKSDFGRFSAANYEIIKIIFEINLRLFNQESAKQLLFVIRDFEDNSENFEFIQETISKDLAKIWEEIKKPAQFENVKAEEFYNVNFFTLPHFIHKKEAFAQRAKELADRLTNPKNENFYYNNVDTSTNMPMDGLYLFIEKVWQSVRENKELNLPSQKIMVSNYRCSEVKRETIDKARPEIQELLEAVQKEFDPNLKNSVEELMNKSMRYFEENTDQYDNDIVEDKEKELKEDLKRQLSEIGDLQEKRVSEIVMKKFLKDMNGYKNFRNFSKLLQACRDLKSNSVNEYKQLLTDSSITENIDEQIAQFNEKIEEKMKEFLKDKIKLLLSEIKKKKLGAMEIFITKMFSELKPGFWDEFVLEFDKVFNEFEEEALALKRDCPELKGTFNESHIDSEKIALYMPIKYNLDMKVKSFKDRLFEKFNREFQNTESGIRRNWNHIEEERINEFFSKAKESTLEVLQSIETAAIPEMLNEPAKSLFGAQELIDIKKNLEDKMNAKLEFVYNKKNNKSGLSNVPWWLWVVLVYFMYDDILNMIRSPFILLMLILCAGGGGYLVATGQWGQFMTVITAITTPITMIIKNSGILPGGRQARAARPSTDDKEKED